MNESLHFQNWTQSLVMMMDYWEKMAKSVNDAIHEDSDYDNDDDDDDFVV